MIQTQKPWLLLPPLWAHGLSVPYLKIYGATHSPQSLAWSALEWRGLKFSNPLGTSGGVDKNAEMISAWWALGAGFVEIGTVTPKPQNPNPGEILKRNTKHLALWNKMGFPSAGVDVVKARLQKFEKPHFTPIFVNIGKNRETENRDAVKDYLYVLKELKPYADAFVVNVSSPNTTGLRELLKPQNISALLEPLIRECDGKIPLLLKLSPDVSDDETCELLDLTHGLGVDGWILTNTTQARSEGLKFPAEGGVSGHPLAQRSMDLLCLAIQHLGERTQNRLIISSGGVLTPDDAFARLRAGADLVQIYSALVFEGPQFFRKVADRANT